MSLEKILCCYTESQLKLYTYYTLVSLQFIKVIMSMQYSLIFPVCVYISCTLCNSVYVHACNIIGMVWCMIKEWCTPHKLHQSTLSRPEVCINRLTLLILYVPMYVNDCIFLVLIRSFIFSLLIMIFIAHAYNTSCIVPCSCMHAFLATTHPHVP